jgi:hypothetical protein
MRWMGSLFHQSDGSRHQHSTFLIRYRRRLQIKESSFEFLLIYTVTGSMVDLDTAASPFPSGMALL